MALLVFVVLLALLFVVYKIYGRIKQSAYHLPPGPRGLPIFGNNLQIAKNAPEQLSKWAKQYGKLYTIRIENNLPTLVVNDMVLMKQLFGTMESTGKFESEIFEHLYDGSNGIVNTEGKVWQEQREFCVKTVKRTFDFGVRAQVESMILTEVDNLGKWMEAKMSADGLVRLSEILKKSIGNTMWCMITGKNLTEAEAHFIEDWMKKLQKVASSGLAFFSWIKYIAPEWSGYSSYVKSCQDLHKIGRRCIDNHKLQIAQGNFDGGDVVSAYIEQMEKMKNSPESSFFGAQGYQHSVQSVNALLMAATETTSTTLHWLIFYLCVHPDVQKKVQQEIDEKIGGDRDPMLADRKLMPYVEAVIQETLRMSSPAPFGVMHRLLEDVTFEQYKLPKNMILLPNLYHVHNDEEIWKDPKVFRPERFFESGCDASQINKLKEFVVPFQVGKRICLGEAVARDTLFLFLTKLLQKFNFFSLPDIGKEMYMKPDIGYFLSPKNLGIKILRRTE